MILLIFEIFVIKPAKPLLIFTPVSTIVALLYDDKLPSSVATSIEAEGTIKLITEELLLPAKSMALVVCTDKVSVAVIVAVPNVISKLLAKLSVEGLTAINVAVPSACALGIMSVIANIVEIGSEKVSLKLPFAMYKIDAELAATGAVVSTVTIFDAGSIEKLPATSAV